MAQAVTGNGTGGTAAIWQGNGTGKTVVGSKGTNGSPWIDVTAYGAVPDWVPGGASFTDNASAIHNALQDCPVTGCTLFFPAGTATSPGSYYVSHDPVLTTVGILVGAGKVGVRLVGGCYAPGSLAPPSSFTTCATIVSDQAVVILQVGNVSTKTHGVSIEDLGFRDASTGMNVVTGAIRLSNVEDFNLTNVRCQGLDTFCIQIDGGNDFAQFGVIVNPSVSNVRFPIQTKGNTSEVNLYGGNLGCTNVSGSTIGIDLGQTNHPTTSNGEWGVYGTHILDCATGLSGYDASVLQFYGVAEVTSSGPPIAGTVGVLLDSDAGKGGGAIVGGSINNYETCVKVTANPFDTRITASLTPHTTVGPPATNDAALNIDPAALPTTLILAPENYPQATQAPLGTASGSQVASDLVLFSQSAASPPTPRALLTTIQNESGTGTTANKLAKLTGAPSTAIITSTSDAQGAAGVVVNGAGMFSASPSAQIATVGQALCVFDNAAGTVAGDFVTISSAVAGDCHDYGSAYPASGQVIGRVLTTNGAAGTYPVSLFGPGQVASAPQVRNSITLTDEFFSAGTGATSAKDVGELGWTISGGASPTKIAGVAQHPGILQRSIGTAFPTVTVTYLGTSSGTSAAPIATLSNAAWSSVFIFRQDPSSTNPNTKIGIRVGFADTVTGNPPSNGIWFENVSGTSAANWAGNVKSGAMSTPANGTVALDTNFHTFEIRNDGVNNITFWIDGSQYGNTVTTNVPAGALQPFFQIINTEAQNKALDIDAFQFTMTVSR